MTQEEKELLIKDLCSRLPYECIISIAEGGIDGIQWADVTLNSYLFHQIMEEDAWEYVKPYLRPMSSMTEEEDAEIANILEEAYNFTFRTEELLENISMQKTFPMAAIDWFYEKGFDIRGLIPKGLALESMESMYKN